MPIEYKYNMIIYVIHAYIYICDRSETKYIKQRETGFHWIPEITVEESSTS